MIFFNFVSLELSTGLYRSLLVSTGLYRSLLVSLLVSLLFAGISCWFLYWSLRECTGLFRSLPVFSICWSLCWSSPSVSAGLWSLMPCFSLVFCLLDALLLLLHPLVSLHDNQRVYLDRNILLTGNTGLVVMYRLDERPSQTSLLLLCGEVRLFVL